MALDELFLVVAFLTFGVHLAFPRTSLLSRWAGLFAAVSFLEMVVWFATHEGAVP